MLLTWRYPTYPTLTLPIVFHALDSQNHPMLIKAYCPARNPDTRSPVRLLPIDVWKTYFTVPVGTLDVENLFTKHTFPFPTLLKAREGTGVRRAWVAGYSTTVAVRLVLHGEWNKPTKSFRVKFLSHIVLRHSQAVEVYITGSEQKALD